MKIDDNYKKCLIKGAFFIALPLILLIPNQAMAADCSQASCGNTICEASCGETSSNCSFDCPSFGCQPLDPCCSEAWCGNGVCETSCGETSSSCFYDCKTNDVITGSLTVSSYSVCLGNGISITLTGQDDDGIVELKLMIDNQSGVREDTFTFSCSGATQCSKAWNIIKNVAGRYKLTAKFFGKKPDGLQEVYSIDDIFIEYKACSAPTVDIKANNSDGPVSISYNTAANLTWTSANANSCTASGGWSGTKATSGSESTGNLISSKTYTITCTGTGGSDSDSVTVNVSVNHPPIANAGPDKEIYETESVILEGSGSDPDGNNITYNWSCNGGTLSASNIAQPTFFAPIITSNTTYTCTLTVTDTHGASDSDSVNILVKEHQCLTLSVSLLASPNSGCAPLNDVDLTASVSGTASGSIIYFFDCQNDGVWEKTETRNETSYTVSNLCYYSTAGNYTAKVRVQREGLSAENTAQINVTSCYNAPTVDIKANGSDVPITINYNNSATLSWTSTNANSCQASAGWSGTKAISGSESTGNLTNSQAFTLTCTGAGGSVSDSITINVAASNNNPPVANAGPDKEVFENNSVYLNGSGYDPDGDTITYSWYCTGGTLSGYNIAQPIFYAPAVSYNVNYTCALTVTDSHGATGSDSMNVLVRKTTQTVPAVDLDANGSDGPITISYNTSANLYWTSSNANYCYASGGWSGNKAISGSEYTGNLTTSQTYTLTCTGAGGSVSDSVTVYVGSVSPVSTFTVNKLVRNLSDGTSWLDSVSADPGETLSFSIQITAGSSYVSNVIVKDTLPDKIKSYGNLKIDGVSSGGDIFAGLNIGDLSSGQTKTITFDAGVLAANNFGYGETQLVNSVLTYNAYYSVSDTAKVVVTKSAVAGAATGVSTGITDNIFLDSFFLPLLITLILIWLFKSRIILFEEWLDLRKKRFQEYHSKRILQLKIAQARTQEFFKGKVF